jgi:hypothetical protein
MPYPYHGVGLGFFDIASADKSQAMALFDKSLEDRAD